MTSIFIFISGATLLVYSAERLIGSLVGISRGLGDLGLPLPKRRLMTNERRRDASEWHIQSVRCSTPSHVHRIEPQRASVYAGGAGVSRLAVPDRRHRRRVFETSRVIALLTLGFTLSLDNFRISIVLGGMKPSLRTSVTTSFIFGVWDGLAPLVGLIIGHFLSDRSTTPPN